MKKITASRSRLTILLLVFLFSTLFFWQAINNYVLIPSRAQLGSNFKVFISEKTIQCNTSVDALCLVHIFGSTESGVGVGGVTGAVKYSDNLTPIGLTQQGFCGQASYNLDAPLQYKTTPLEVAFSLGALRGDNQLVSGNKCITTIGFKRNVTDPSDTTTAQVSLADTAVWQAVGSKDLVPQADTSPVTISFSTSAPIPTITITPPVGGPTGTPDPSLCLSVANGDCNCDKSVNVVDWEMLRSAIRSEGQVCDPNGDGFINAVDLSIWRDNHE